MTTARITTKRTITLSMLWRADGTSIRSALVGLTAFDISPRREVRPQTGQRCGLVVLEPYLVQIVAEKPKAPDLDSIESRSGALRDSYQSAPAACRIRLRAAASGVAHRFRRALPLRNVVRNHPGRFHRRLAELGIAGDFALHALAFVVKQFAQGFQFGNQFFDFGQ